MLRCLNVSVLRQDPEGSLAPHDVREASGPIEPSDLFDVGHICHSGRRPSSAMKHGSQSPSARLSAWDEACLFKLRRNADVLRLGPISNDQPEPNEQREKRPPEDFFNPLNHWLAS
jgi:hypothetical protein